MVIKYRKLGNKSDIAIFLDKKKLKYYLGWLRNGLGEEVLDIEYYTNNSRT